MFLLPSLVCACCLGGVRDGSMLPWKWCDVTELVMTIAGNVEGQGDAGPFALDCSSVILDSKDTEKHVQDPEVYFKNFLPLKTPQ